MLVLGIETSCDETSAAVVRNGRDVLSDVVWSQVRLHAPYGGVVPELASRAHVRNISTVVDLALRHAGVGLEEICMVAVTRGPGLIGSLLVGLEFAKALAFARQLPLVAVHHVAAHLYSPFLRQHPEAHALHTIDAKAGKRQAAQASLPAGKQEARGKRRVAQASLPAGTQEVRGKRQEARGERLEKAPIARYPYLGLTVSGGHTSLTRVEAPGRYHTLGETRDDAVGEAYDKVAKLLGLGYPGGPILDALARQGDPCAIRFPRPLAGRKTLDFSFSGLKTAVLHHVEKVGIETICGDHARLCDLAASFQAAVIDSLLEKTRVALAHERLDALAVVGGVACNTGLREALRAMRLRGKEREARGERREARGQHSAFRIPHSAFSSSFILHPSSFRLWIPPPVLCTDNAAMIAGLGYHLARAGRRDNDLALDADPGWLLNDE